MNARRRTTTVTLVLLALVALAVLLAGCSGQKAGTGATATKWQCPMHPTVIRDEPGDCPICGMRLVPMAREGTPAPAAGAPSAAPPAPASSPSGTGRKIRFYRNPMNPGVTSPVPAKDEMGMDYVPVYEDEIAPAGNVEGLAPVQMSAEGLRLSGIATAVATQETLAREIRAVGQVVADEKQVRHVHTKVSGYVEKLFVDFTGDTVRRGQPLLSIYSPELLATQEEFLRARDAAKRFASASLPEVREGGEELLTAARRRLELFDVPADFIARLEATGQPQRTVALLAPVSGFVTSKGVYAGQQVDPSMELYTVSDLSHVWIEADVYESEMAAVKVGQEARLDSPYDPSLALTGRVAFVYPWLNPEARTLKVRFDFPNAKLALKPAMYVNVTLSVHPRPGVVIPETAVIDTGVRQVVFVLAGNDRFEPREIKAGARSGGKVQVESGVAAGERVVVKANFLLDSESRLRAAVAGVGNGTHR